MLQRAAPRGRKFRVYSAERSLSRSSCGRQLGLVELGRVVVISYCRNCREVRQA